MIAKVFKGIWTGINFSRRLILNVLFLFLVVIFIVSVSSDGDKIIVEEGSVLRLNLNGPIVEEKTYIDPVEAAINDATASADSPSEILLDDVVEVINEAFLDKTDRKGRFVAVQVKFKEKLKRGVPLEEIKKNKALSHLSLVKQSRLSVMPIDFKSWKIIYNMSRI